MSKDRINEIPCLVFYDELLLRYEYIGSEFSLVFKFQLLFINMQIRLSTYRTTR